MRLETDIAVSLELFEPRDEETPRVSNQLPLTVHALITLLSDYSEHGVVRSCRDPPRSEEQGFPCWDSLVYQTARSRGRTLPVELSNRRTDGCAKQLLLLFSAGLSVARVFSAPVRSLFATSSGCSQTCNPHTVRISIEDTPCVYSSCGRRGRRVKPGRERVTNSRAESRAEETTT